jgi:hypothetical protein
MFWIRLIFFLTKRSRHSHKIIDIAVLTRNIIDGDHPSIWSKYIKIRKYDLLWLLLFSHIIKNAYIVIAIKNTYERKMNERKMTDILRMKEKWLIFYSLACMHIFFILLIKRLTFKWLYTIISDITYILWSRNKCQSKLKLEI